MPSLPSLDLILIAATVLVLAAGIVLFILWRRKPKDKEQRRRLMVNQYGRIGDATITDIALVVSRATGQRHSIPLRSTPNNDVYGGLSLSDPDIADLLASIRASGLLEPLRISQDNYLISGHRRRFCAAARFHLRLSPPARCRANRAQ